MKFLGTFHEWEERPQYGILKILHSLLQTIRHGSDLFHIYLLIGSHQSNHSKSQRTDCFSRKMAALGKVKAKEKTYKRTRREKKEKPREHNGEKE
jgi:hypothetical protein